jgi:hypothetical protein
MRTVNDDSRVVNKLEASLTDDTRVIIYGCHIFIVQAIGFILETSLFLNLYYKNLFVFITDDRK